MLRIQMRFSVLSMILVQASQGLAQTSMAAGGSARNAIAALYAQQDSAISRCQLGPFLATLAPTYAVLLRDGQRFVRPGIDSAIARDMRLTVAVRRASTDIEQIAPVGDTLVAVVVHRADRDLRDAEGQRHRWENAVRHEERWVADRNGWRLIQLRELQQLYLRRDGVDRMVPSAPPPPPPPPRDSAVRAVVERYLHGLKFNDTLGLAQAFWPDARLLFVGSDGQVSQLTQRQWYATFAGNVGHEEEGNLRVAAVEVTHDAASVKVVEDYQRSRYTDYLSLLLIQGRWWIVNKIYTVEPRAP